MLKLFNSLRNYMDKTTINQIKIFIFVASRLLIHIKRYLNMVNIHLIPQSYVS